ncbi:MAG: hypothetical protein LBE31_10360 [Deltaproteobacteria bacterium]|jgi:hypothetical protein|nr:hypothetical protein [Deltaproteobacteria bacterium]
MQNETLLKREGLRILVENLGLVSAERFIALMRREQFDYTQWQRELFKDVPLDKFLRDADRYRQKNEP